MENRWQDAMKALAARNAPTPVETDRFVRSVLRRLEPQPSPWLLRLQALLQARWTVPALSVGLATVFLAIGMQSQEPLDLQLLLGPASGGATQLALPPDPTAQPSLLAPEAP